MLEKLTEFYSLAAGSIYHMVMNRAFRPISSNEAPSNSEAGKQNKNQQHTLEGSN